MPAFEVLSSAVSWLPWGSAAFDRARAEHKPVLLSLAAAWCESCLDMDTTTYTDPNVATFINRRFIPVRVDVDRRPDISERYTLGGWPTTAFLTPQGAVLGGGTFVPRDRMLPILARVVEAFALASEEASPESVVSSGLNPPSPSSPPSSSPLGSPAPDLLDSVFESFDQLHGGFGGEPKFPLAAPLQLALELARGDGHPRYRQIVESSLDAMGWGGLYDEIDGGFFRYSSTSDWQTPHSEKLLETNSALLRLYLDAGATLGQARFTERGADVLRYIQTWLADPVDGGWWGSQRADARYYAAASVDERRLLAPPPAVRVLYADANAVMTVAALQAADVFGDDGLRDFALKSFERVLLACYKPGAGVAHSFDGHPGARGLLADQAAMAAASLAAFELTDNVVYEMMAEELAHYAVRLMWDDSAGGFFDRAEGPDQPIGLMRRRLKPFATNCDFARTLRTLAGTSGNHDFAMFADRTLAAMEPLASDEGPLAAYYLLAMRPPTIR